MTYHDVSQRCFMFEIIYVNFVFKIQYMRTRKNIRLRNYDYRSQGWYFITICTQNREHDFGDIREGKMELSPIGKQANVFLEEIPEHFTQVELGEFVVMPNHIHILIGIGVGTRDLVSANNLNNMSGNNIDGVSVNNMNNVSAQNKKVMSDHGFDAMNNHHINGVSNGNNIDMPDNKKQTKQFGGSLSGSISTIIGQFKSTLSRWCNKNGYAWFAWQSRFHDHVVRDQKDYDRIQEYIINNPTNWTTDKMFIP